MEFLLSIKFLKDSENFDPPGSLILINLRLYFFRKFETSLRFVDFPEASIPSNIITGNLYIAPYQKINRIKYS